MSTVNRVKKRGKVTYNPVEPVECGTKKFRMHARRFLLTYRCVPEGLTRQSVIKQLDQNLSVNKSTPQRLIHQRIMGLTGGENRCINLLIYVLSILYLCTIYRT